MFSLLSLQRTGGAAGVCLFRRSFVDGFFFFCFCEGNSVFFVLLRVTFLIVTWSIALHMKILAKRMRPVADESGGGELSDLPAMVTLSLDDFLDTAAKLKLKSHPKGEGDTRSKRSQTLVDIPQHTNMSTLLHIGKSVVCVMRHTHKKLLTTFFVHSPGSSLFRRCRSCCRSNRLRSSWCAPSHPAPEGQGGRQGKSVTVMVTTAADVPTEATHAEDRRVRQEVDRSDVAGSPQFCSCRRLFHKY